MEMMKDEWVKSAMMDDGMVVELLVGLKESRSSSPMESSPSVVIPLRWGLRLPRSRMASAFRCEAFPTRDKEADSFRCSPTTPLSWSAGTSTSATADGFEESSRSSSLSHADARSKVATATIESNKRFRRKKTFAELKGQEECLLLGESTHLRKELGTLRVCFEEQSTCKESMKRIKLNLNLHCSTTISDTSSQPHQKPGPIGRSENNHCAGTQNKCNSTEDAVFLLPDLNMMPSED